MAISWIEQAKEFKSPLPVVAGFLLRSRETKASKCKQLLDQNGELHRQRDRQTQQLRQQEQEIARLKQHIQKLEMQRHADSTNQTVTLR